jgi:manganese/zinc/iron transport system permease protein
MIWEWSISWLALPDDLWRVLSLRDYNTRVVVLGTALLGAAAGVIGSFALLRKRALLGDALSHAMLPGIALAYLAAVWLGAEGKSVPLLLFGATLSGLLGTCCVLGIRHWTRLKEDAALSIVLSVFFGAGVALLGIVQQTARGHAAGLESFVFGKASALAIEDAWVIMGGGLVCVLLVSLFFKEWKLLCFDETFAASNGWPVVGLDWLMMFLIVLISVVGLQAVGLVLMIALLVIPPAAARFWTDDLRTMVWLAGVLGCVSSFGGAIVSALLPRLPSGAMIVLFAGAIFLVSLLLGTRRGVFYQAWQSWSLQQRIQRQHLLRAMFELSELQEEHSGSSVGQPVPVDFERLQAMRSWSKRQLAAEVRRAISAGLVIPLSPSQLRLTAAGQQLAARLVHQHRLWELYLITHAELAPSKVDRDADRIEHVLTPEMIARLERLLNASQQGGSVPVSPHPILPPAAVEPAGGGRP